MLHGMEIEGCFLRPPRCGPAGNEWKGPSTGSCTFLERFVFFNLYG